MLSRVLIFAAVTTALYCSGTETLTEIYPLDRATILAGSKFDFKVEFPAVLAQDKLRVEINGKGADSFLGKSLTYIEKERFMPRISKQAQAEADAQAATKPESEASKPLPLNTP